MALAPNIADLQRSKKAQSTSLFEGEKMPQSDEKQQPRTKHHDISNGCSSIQIIGAGGAGKVCAIRFAEQFPNALKISTIDTSGVPNDISGIEIFKVKDLNGSGKLRKNNIEPITNFVADYVARKPFEDITIIIMSLSGGSGSVVGPLLIDEILRQNKIAIVFGIIDTDSEIDTLNALNGLRTLDNISSNRKGYLPIILFSNKDGRSIVDKGIDKQLKHLVTMLTIPYIGLDTQDRIKFLNPHAFDSIEHGVKLLSVSSRPDGDWETDLGLIIPDDNHEKIDAALIISHIDTNLQLKKRCSVTYRGFYEEEGINIVASIGYQIPESLIKELNANIHAFRSTNTKPKTKIEAEYEIGETKNNGLVL